MIFNDASHRATIAATAGKGFTLPVTSRNCPFWETGYMVGRPDIMPSLVCPAEWGSNIAINIGVAMRVAEALGLFAESRGIWDTELAVGGWLDEETGTYYVDISQHFQDRDEALEFAASLGEKAIWDVVNRKDIKVS